MTADASKNGGKTRGKPFERESRWPPGRPQGSRISATIALDKMAESEGKEILRMTLEDAKAGDANARKLVLDRIWPVLKGRPVSMTDATAWPSSGVISRAPPPLRPTRDPPLESRVSGLEQERKA